jgi:hypothetical protein
MEKGNLNVIIFDDEELSIKDHRESRTANSSKHNQTQNNNNQFDVIEQ